MIDKIEIYPETGVIQYREAADVVNPLTGQTMRLQHRASIHPEDDVTDKPAAVQALAAQFHTAEVLQARLDALAEKRNERGGPASAAEQRLAGKLNAG